MLFGFGASLFAVVASIVAADFFFAPPEFQAPPTAAPVAIARLQMWDLLLTDRG